MSALPFCCHRHADARNQLVTLARREIDEPHGGPDVRQLTLDVVDEAESANLAQSSGIDVRHAAVPSLVAGLRATRALRSGLSRMISDEKALELARKISPVTHVRADSAPALIIHGDADFLVPIQQAEAIIDAGVQSFTHWLDQRATVPLANKFLSLLTDYTKMHPDFQPILDKYKIQAAPATAAVRRPC